MRFHKITDTAYRNFLRARFERITGQTQVCSFPYIMGIEASSHCQLRCPMCPTGLENEARRQGEELRYRIRAHLDEAVFEELLCDLGDYLFLIMFYNWGEPLLNKNLPKLVRRARSYQIATEIHSNLSLPLSDELIFDLLTAGIDSIEASLDGFSQGTYVLYRRGGDFELAKSNLVRLAAARDRLGLGTKIVWNFLVFRWNEHEIEATKNFCDSIGIIFNQRDAFVGDPDWLPSYRRQDIAQTAPPESASQPAENEEPLQPERARAPSTCGWHYSYTTVDSIGSISPCCVPWEDKHDFGRLEPGETGFGDIWNNERYRKARGIFSGQTENLPVIETLCDHCPYDTSIQNLYSPLDQKVIEQLQNVPGLDWRLRFAFSVLDNREIFTDFFRHHFD